MNEKQTNNQPEKGLDDKRKNAMLRYIGFMFIVAFVFVLVSMLGELRSSEATISELNQSSTSAITKAEQLQDHNRQLEKDNSYLTGRIEELEKQLEDLELELAVSREKVDLQKEELSDYKHQLDAQKQLTETEQETIAYAYELLLQASHEEDPAATLAELKVYEQYLGENALNLYENLTKKGEE